MFFEVLGYPKIPRPFVNQSERVRPLVDKTKIEGADTKVPSSPTTRVVLTQDVSQSGDAAGIHLRPRGRVRQDHGQMWPPVAPLLVGDALHTGPRGRDTLADANSRS